MRIVIYKPRSRLSPHQILALISYKIRIMLAYLAKKVPRGLLKYIKKGTKYNTNILTL